MARKTQRNILEIDNLIGKLDAFNDAASAAANSLFEFQAMTDEEKKKAFGSAEAQAAEEKRLRKAKNRADGKLKVETEKLTQVVGDSSQKFQDLAEGIRSFALDLSNTGGAFDNLLGAGGKGGILGFFGQMSQEQSDLLLEIKDRNEKLKQTDITQRQREIALDEIAEKEYQIKLFQGITERLQGSAKEVDKLFTGQGVAQIDFGARQRRMDELTGNRVGGPLRTKSGGVDMRQKNASLIVAEEGANQLENALAAMNAQFNMGVELTKNMLGNITGMLDNIPIIGGLISGVLNKAFEQGVSIAGAKMAAAFKRQKKDVKQMTAYQKVLNFITNLNPYAAIAAAIIVALGAIVGMIAYTRNLAKELGVSVNTAKKFRGEIFAASAQLAFFGQDAKAISGELVDAFGNTERISTNTIVEIGKVATKLGAETKDIISIQKQLMDMTGASADASMELITNIGRIADAEGVGAGNVIADIASNMATFAEFSTMGAQGLAEAAVQAAKVGSSLSNVNAFAEKLIDFETSITKEFEAQVLTGKNLNLERARELALQGKMGELSQELQAQVGGLGDLQSMNVVEKRAISAAIGVSVADLQKISRGEAIEQKKTQEDLLSELIEVNKKGFKGNEAAFGKGDTSFNNFMNYGD